jgi:excisionase family DNA binding protein
MGIDFDQILDGYRDRYPPTLTTTQVAEMLGTSPGEIRTMAASAEIPAYRWGKKYRYFRDEVIAWLRDLTIAAEKDAVASDTASASAAEGAESNESVTGDG